MQSGPCLTSSHALISQRPTLRTNNGEPPANGMTVMRQLQREHRTSGQAPSAVILTVARLKGGEACFFPPAVQPVPAAGTIGT